MGVNGVNDHHLDSNEWQIPANAVYRHKGDDSTKSRYHIYKCGCHDGYNCVAGCSPPFNGHTCTRTLTPTTYPTSSPTNYPTPYPTPTPTAYPTPAPTTYPTPYPTPYPTSMPTPAPTPSPTPSPTPAPTPYCPVTCKHDHNHRFVNPALKELDGCDRYGNVHGDNFVAGSILDKRFNKLLHSECNFKGRKTKRIVTTHDVELMNEHDSFRKHRCYSYKGKCMCECIENSDYFMDGTIQGNAVGNTEHRDVSEGQSLRHDNELLWKAPKYYVQDEEIQAIRACCHKEFDLDPSLLLPSRNCKQVAEVQNEEIRDEIMNNMEKAVSNRDIINWLTEQKCYNTEHQTSADDNGNRATHWDGEASGHDHESISLEPPRWKKIQALLRKVKDAAGFSTITKDDAKGKVVSQGDMQKVMIAANKAGDYCKYSKAGGKIVESEGAPLVFCYKCSKKCNGSFSFDETAISNCHTMACQDGPSCAAKLQCQATLAEADTSSHCKCAAPRIV